MKAKNIITVLLWAATLLTADAKDSKLTQAMKGADSIVWAGLDYSLVKMIGSTNAIRAPGLLLQDMPSRWNDLFLDERIEDVGISLGKLIHIDIAGVTERNRQLKPSQVELNSPAKDIIKESHLTAKGIADAVQSMKLSRTEGLGLVFIVDRLVSERRLKPRKNQNDSALNYIERAGAAYVVFFDVATREVLSMKREARVTGSSGNFRNSWFGPVKEIDEGLSQYRE